MYDFLRKIPMFADLTDDDLNALCERVEEMTLVSGQLLFPEGSRGDRAYVIQDGEVEVIKAVGEREVLLAVRHAGEVIGEMALLEDQPRMAGVRARTPATLLAIHHDDLDTLLATSPTAARAMLHTITARWRVTEALLRQSEKMAQLGTLTAGVAHELNNPSSAVQRGVGQLRDAVEQMQAIFLKPEDVSFSPDQRELLREIDDQLQRRALNPLVLDPLECSDLEQEMEAWLDERGVDNAWELTGTLVSLGYDMDRLQMLADAFAPSQLPAAIRWLASSYTVYSLLESVGSGAARISEIVKSLKTYVFLDQAPVQPVDVHEGLVTTIGLLRSRLRPGITIHQDFSRDLPRILAYGSELNQVWTNLLDNALDAIEQLKSEPGEIVIRTCREKDDWIAVEIEDNGPGIPDAIQDRVFDPFFTTKPPGQGTGVGLSVAYNVIAQKHRGEISFHSRPGKTAFRVRLPVNFELTSQLASPVVPQTEGMDEPIRQILESSTHIAVVGISDDPNRPACTVPGYLRDHGYHIIPINPTLTEWSGEPAYPDLAAVAEPVDVVLIFRAREHAPAIVGAAIAAGARVVWMQEGIVNEQAAQTARDAGLQVVMDACMRVHHQRLIVHTPSQRG